jgi:hypothetical protein
MRPLSPQLFHDAHLPAICEAGRVLNRSDLCELSTRRLSSVLQTSASTGDFRWKGGARRYNIGLFCGLAGVGYTCSGKSTAPCRTS